MSRRRAAPSVFTSLAGDDAPPWPDSPRRASGGTGLAGGSMTQQVAFCVLMIALLGVVFAYLANMAQFEASRFKSEAAERHSQAAARLGEFHARRTDQALNELARDLVEPAQRKADLQARVDALKEEKEALRRQADKLGSEALLWDEQSRKQLAEQHHWIEAIMVLQLALLLAAIALLTRKVWVEGAMVLAGLVGAALGVIASLYG